MNNKIVKLKRQQAQKIIKDKGKDPTCIIVVIDGREITVWEDYINKISELLDFPLQYEYSKDSYIDWMTDLEWLKKESFIIIINNYDEFMINNLEDKKEVMQMFKDDILPFWEKDVLRIMTNGHLKSFSVYLVD